MAANKCMQTKWPNSEALDRKGCRQAESLWQTVWVLEPLVRFSNALLVCRQTIHGKSGCYRRLESLWWIASHALFNHKSSARTTLMWRVGAWITCSHWMAISAFLTIMGRKNQLTRLCQSMSSEVLSSLDIHRFTLVELLRFPNWVNQMSISYLNSATNSTCTGA